ncbi:tubulin-specific chaperone D [Ditylenchus destructor]|nr:tubulin-specific chaperone D [Ditylenchus destructor]
MEVIGCTPIQLENSHAEEMRQLVSALPEVVKQGTTNIEYNLERFEKLVMLYSEEPQLMDPILRHLVNTLISFVDWPTSLPFMLSDLSVAALRRLRTITRTRGYKIMIRMLPHEVDHMENILLCLEHYACEPSSSNGNSRDKDAQVIFMLTVWLLIICKNPFCLSRFDTSASQNGTKPVAQRIVDSMTTIQEQWIPLGEMSIVSTLLAQILTRNKDNSDVLRPRINQAIEVLKGKREEMQPYALKILEQTSGRLINVECVNIEVRNLVTKLLQRIALMLLKPRLASWRYKCGYRSLEDTLKGRSGSEATKSANVTEDSYDEKLDDEARQVPYEQIESIIGELLSKINARDNVVRWTAAKGIARISSRLPRELAAQVVASILESSFNDLYNGGTWHGGCLALAELCRRGCLLPDQVPEVLKVLSNALLFEQYSLGFSVSASVRDAACYICWAFARAYEAKILKQHVQTLAGDLVCVALFDREVNIRRAASAAFQENVGRNDSFPHGIQILTIIDYIDVALIKNCYLELSVLVANYPEYRIPLLSHLCHRKSQHWDEAVRELASDALQRLVQFDVKYTMETVLPELTKRLSDDDPSTKHGTLFAISALLMGMHESANLSVDSIPSLDSLLLVVPQSVIHLKNHRVKGFPLISKALSRFIQGMCTINVPLTDSQLKQFHDILDGVVSDKNKRLHPYAVSAFSALMKYYDGDRFEILVDRVLKKYFPNIEQSCEDELERVSSIAPLAHIPKEFLSNNVTINNTEGVGFTQSLGEAIIIRLLKVIYDESTPKWVFARVAAMETISDIVSKYDSHLLKWEPLIDSCIHLSDDYTTTINGNIGRFSRRAAVLAMCKILPLAHSANSINKETVNLCLAKVAQRCCEAIDDLRSTGCLAMTTLLDTNLPIEDRELLEGIFKLPETPRVVSGSRTLPMSRMGEEDEMFSEVDWRHSSGFLRLAKLLDSTVHKRCALEGFVLSAGSVDGWTSQSAFSAIVQHLKPVKRNFEAMDTFLSDLLYVYKQMCARKADASCMLTIFRMLLDDRMFVAYEADPDSSELFTELCQEVIKLALGRGKPKIKSLAISVLGCLLQFNPRTQLHCKSLSVVLSMLDSPYVMLRECAAEQLFEALNGLLDESVYEPISHQRALEIISQTQWRNTAEPEVISKAKEELSKLLIID